MVQYRKSLVESIEPTTLRGTLQNDKENLMENLHISHYHDVVEKLEGGAQVGDIVKLDLLMTPENGYVPEPLFDTHGVMTFVLGWGNYLPGLHQSVEGCQVGDVVQNVSIDAGWGSRRKDLIFQVPRHKLDKIIVSITNTGHDRHTSQETPLPQAGSTCFQIGSTLKLSGGIEVMVSDIQDDSEDPGNSVVVLDANPPLAGTSYACSFRVLEISRVPNDLFEYQTSRCKSDANHNHRYDVATFALGCFWGGQLAFSRLEGVVGTQVGYSQGITKSPTYEEVCTGRTQHREAVRVLFDTTVVSYQDLMNTALERLDQTTSSLELHRLFRDESSASSSLQYKHGFYFHKDEQKRAAVECLERGGNRFGVEVQQISRFFQAEEYHQHYLFKGGQSTRKGSKDTIRCFG